MITAQGYNAQQSTIVIPPNGEVTQPTVTMVPVLGKIVGKIILEGASDFTGIQVTAFNYASETWSTTTSFDGTFTLELPIGNYAGVRATISRYSSETYTDTLTVVENGQVNIPVITLEQNSNALTGQLSSSTPKTRKD